MNSTASTSPLSAIGFGQILPALKILLEATAHRGELATAELGEARDHAVVTVALGFAAAALALLGGFAATFTLAALVWDRPERGLILGAVTGAYLLGAAGIAWFAARRLRDWRPLGETRHQLRQDQVCLQEILTPARAPR